jgi:hypothetical protein
MDWEKALLGLGVLVAAVQASITYWLTRRQLNAQVLQQKTQFEWSRRESALEYSMTRNALVRDARLGLDDYFGGVFYEAVQPTEEELVEKMWGNHSLYTNISTLLSHYELLALAIRMDIVNATVAREMYAPTVIETLRFFRTFIEHRQRANPTAYEYVVDIAYQWEREMEQKKGLVELPRLAQDN